MFDNFFQRMWTIISAEYRAILEGLGNTLLIAVFAFIIGLAIGCLIATIKLIPKKSTSYFLKAVEVIDNVYIAIFRGTPVVVQLLFIYYAIFKPMNVPALTVAIIVFGLNSGAYVSEIMRGGILSIDKGQLEAGRSLGLNYAETMFKIILPQGVKNAIPNLANEFIALLKETSIVGFITVIDLTKAIQIIMGWNYFYAAGYFLLGLVYFVIIYTLTKLIAVLERRLRRSDNR